MKRALYLAALAPLALLAAACGSTDTEDTTNTEVVTATEAAPTEEETTEEAPAERTDFIVFIEEPEPLSVFTYDNFVCSTHREMSTDFTDRPDAPRVQLYDADEELLATQELADTGPILDDVCSMHLKILDVPVSESYRVIFSGEDGDGVPYQLEGVTTFDQGKFDEGYTQSHRFELD